MMSWGLFRSTRLREIVSWAALLPPRGFPEISRIPPEKADGPVGWLPFTTFPRTLVWRAQANPTPSPERGGPSSPPGQERLFLSARLFLSFHFRAPPGAPVLITPNPMQLWVARLWTASPRALSRRKKPYAPLWRARLPRRTAFACGESPM